MRFEQAVVSVVSNAIQASTAGQTVRVAARLCDQATGCWEIEVADDGSGIAPDVIDKVFLPFFTTKADGTGLGLGLAKSIIEQHGGQILVSSTPGRGSVFTLRLPVISPTPTAVSS